MFTPYKGRFRHQWGPKKASQILSEGAVIDVINGYVDLCTITRGPHSGVCQKTITAADSDYASATRIPYLVPIDPSAEWKVDSITGSPAATDVGNFVDLGGSPVGAGVTVATSDDDAFLVTRYLSAQSSYTGILNSYKANQNGIGTAA
jgi:hypothetical protein